MRATLLVLLLTAAMGMAQQRFLPSVVATPGEPTGVLYGTFNGSFLRSADGGSTWTPMYITEPGLPQPPSLALELDALANNTLYLATTRQRGLFWKSTDGGDTWAQAIAGLPSGGLSPDTFIQYRDGGNVVLYLKIGSSLYKSNNRGGIWFFQGTFPAAAGVFTQAPGLRARMYFIDSNTLQAYTSIDEGHSWTRTVQVANFTGNVSAESAAVPFTNSDWLYTTVGGLGFGTGAYLSRNTGATFTDQLAAGLGAFDKFFTGPVGPWYASVSGGTGFYRSLNQGTSWNKISGSPVNFYDLTAVDPHDRLILYANRGGNLRQLARSEDGGDSWVEIIASTTPTLAKPAPSIDVTLVQGAPYAHAITAQAVEDASWAMPVTVTTSGEPWLQVAAASGTTPLANSINIDTTNLAPGSYTATVTISSPQSFNQSVTIPINLTVVGYGTQGPQYFISTVAGNGGALETRTTGNALDLAIGATRALAFGPTGRLWISAGNRLWRADGAGLDAMAGTGQAGSDGDGSGPLAAKISDPSAIAFDAQSQAHFAEFASRRVRRIANNTIRTDVDFQQFNFTTGSRGLLVDPFGRLILLNPGGVLRYDGARLQVVTPYAFGDPYSIVADAAGNYYISDRAQHRIYKVTPAGAVSVFAGAGTRGFRGDGGPALDAWFNAPSGLALGPDGTLYVADTGNQRVRAIAPGGTIRTIAGSGLVGFSGAGETADFASFNDPVAVAVGADGRIYIADSKNNRVRMLELRDVEAPPPPPPPNKPEIDRIGRGGSEGGPVSPGAVFSIYGSLLSNATLLNDTVPWPRTLEGVRVTINGIEVPLYFISPSQINGQIPYEVGLGNATMVVTVDGVASEEFSFPVAAASPGILLYSGTHAVAVNQDGRVNAPGVPASPGEYIVLYLSGIGQPTETIATGAAAPGDPLAWVNYNYTIKLGDAFVTEIIYLGHTPGYPALAQANFQVPDLPPGDYLIVITVNGVASNSAVFTVGP